MKKIGASIRVVVLILSFGSIVFAASAHCDFNNDGFDDLAIGVANEGVNGHPAAGAVNVLYGRSGGLSATNNQFWTKDSPGILGDAADLDVFGIVLSCGDFNGDRNDDLAITAFADVNGHRDAGEVTVLYGTRTSGLSATKTQLWTQDSPGVLNRAEGNDAFGSSLAAGDFNGDGYDDLAIGVPGEDLLAADAGAVHILYGTGNGLSSTGNQFWREDSEGIINNAEFADQFGVSLVAGNFGKDGSKCYDDLAIGVPGEPINGIASGAVHVLYGSDAGLSATGSQFWSEESSGIPGTAGFDQFGGSLAAGTFRASNSTCGTKIEDLVIGADFKTIGSASEAGAVFVIYGTTSGLTATNSQMWNEDSPDIAGVPEEPDFFGSSIAAGHTTSGHDYLAIGVPNESVDTAGGAVRAGAVHILFTDPLTGRLTAAGSKFYHESTPGIKDTVEAFDEFGSSLATGDFDKNGTDDLAIGSPGEDLNSSIEVGAVHVLYSADTAFTQFWHQNSIDVKDFEEDRDRFGWSLSR